MSGDEGKHGDSGGRQRNGESVMTKFIWVLLTCGVCLTASTIAPVALADSSSPAPSSAQQAAQEELVRRQAAQIQAHQLMDDGEKLYYAGKYDQAVVKLEAAIKLVPPSPATQVDYDRAVRGLTTSYIHLANTALQNGDYPAARGYAQHALSYDPENRNAEDIIARANREQATGIKMSPSGPSPDQTPEFLAKKDQIKKLFREGKILMNSGQYDEAQKRFEEVLLIDPYNEDATTLLKNLDKQRQEIGTGVQEENRVRRLREVTDAWASPISREVKPPSITTGIGPIDSEAVRQQKIVEKLNKIIIPEINFREAVVSDVITFLGDESRRLDLPDHAGVNIVLSGGVGGPAAPAAPAAAAPTVPAAAPEPAGAAGAAPPPAPETVEGRKITLSLRNVPMIDALKYVTQLADLKFRIEPSAVIVSPTDAPEGPMVVRTYRVTAGAFLPGWNITNYPSPTQITQPTGGGGGGASQATALTPVGPSTVLPEVSFLVDTNGLKNLFLDAGVQFPTNSSISYHEQSSTLIVRNTPENLETLERVLDVFNTIPSQVEIEAKFVEINQNDLDE